MNPLLRDELASILAESGSPPKVSPEFEHPPVDVSPRARKVRAIFRLADMYGWRCAVTDFLDECAVSYVSDLSEDQVDSLLHRMRSFVDAAETGASIGNYLPAY